MNNEMILASAGSGKTWQLTNRFIKLMAAGVDPARIIALTFTVKAAGEFFDAILNKLANAAADPEEAKQLAAAIEEPGLNQKRCLHLLDTLVESMARLNLGTLDSFFFRVVRCFPYELGLSGQVRIMDEAAQRRARRSILQRIFRPAQKRDGEQMNFIQAFKQATWGHDAKSLTPQLDEFISRFHNLYHLAPDQAAWGNSENRIWPPGTPPWINPVAQTALDDARSYLIQHANDYASHANQVDTLIALFELIATWQAGAIVTKELNTPLGNLVGVATAVFSGSATFNIKRRVVNFDAQGCAALTTLLHHLLGEEYRRKLQVTEGLYAIMAQYSGLYDQQLLARGQQTFADILRLLSNPHSPELTLDEAALDRLALDYRLDGRFDHWLLDEFQDTSPAQWGILQPLIDEVIQDPGGQRTFFYVGDVKQAIYGWRDGDARLFRQIYRHYNQGKTSAIVERQLNDSWRSGPAVIDAVNTVFGQNQALKNLFGQTVANRWMEGWREHKSIHADRDGHVAWISSDNINERDLITLNLIKTINPVGRGLNCAVLVLNNKEGQRLSNYLRSAGALPVIRDAAAEIGRDNPLATTLRALITYAIHPVDTFALGQLMMTPVRVWLEREDLKPAQIIQPTLRQIHRQGFESLVNLWIERLDSVDPLDHFLRDRATALLEAAREFDLTGSRDADDFLEHCKFYEKKDPATDGVIQVMTIHKAKGLDFDVVILPDLKTKGLLQRRKGLTIARDAFRKPQWILDAPNKEYALPDATLTAAFEEEMNDEAYEKLCVLYVALTRAKRAVYLIAEPNSDTSDSANYIRLLEDTLGEQPTRWIWDDQPWEARYSVGNPDWWKAMQKQSPRPAQPQPPIPSNLIAQPRLAREQPSREDARSTSGRELFSPEKSAALHYGTAVHAALEKIAWLEGDEPPHDRFADDTIRRDLITCLAKPAVRALFTQPQEPVKLWREKNVEAIIGNRWFSGTLDRVILTLDPNGRPVRAQLIDFKTDRIATEEARVKAIESHRRQLERYRTVLAMITGLSEEAITPLLVFTRSGEVVTLER